MEKDQEIAQLKQSIKRLLVRIPPAVNAGSNELAVAYKKAAVAATKEVSKSRPGLALLQQAYRNLNSFY